MSKEYPKPDPKAVAKISRDRIPTTPVKSSQLAAVGYDRASETLAIRFKGRSDGTPGALYHYSNVSPSVHKSLLEAESVGSFFHGVIKPNPQQYPYVRIVEDDEAQRNAA